MASSLAIGLGVQPRNFHVIKKYDDDFGGHAELGDLFLVQRNNGVHHAGVCCSEDEEIIHFIQKVSGSSFPLASGAGVSVASLLTGITGPLGSAASGIGAASVASSVRFYPGLVSKVRIDDFHQGDKFAIYKKTGGIPSSFRENVRKAMKAKHEYNVLQYNCIHFAMELLEVRTSDGEVEKLLRSLGLL